MAKHYSKKRREELKSLFLETLEESRGMITTSLAAIGVTKQTLSNWRKDDQEFSDKIDEIKDRQKEWVQGKLMTLIENGNATATIFFLKTQCGWKEAQKVEVETVGDVDVKAAIEEIRKELADGNE